MSHTPAIIYDGQCRFCLWSMRRIRKFARDGQFEYLPRQQPGLEERYPILAQSDFNTGLRLIHPDGTVHVGADGVYEIYRHLSPFHLVAWIYRLPLCRQVFRLGYALIARNRHRFGRVPSDPGCTDDACTLSFGEKQATDP
jgi:predicted DCC family thiol-disulfide oxidoreductase YuxK